MTERGKRVIEIATSSEDIRSAARDLIASHGKAAVTVAEWHALEHQDSGRTEEAKKDYHASIEIELRREIARLARPLGTA